MKNSVKFSLARPHKMVFVFTNLQIANLSACRNVERSLVGSGGGCDWWYSKSGEHLNACSCIISLNERVDSELDHYYYSITRFTRRKKEGENKKRRWFLAAAVTKQIKLCSFKKREYDNKLFRVDDDEDVGSGTRGGSGCGGGWKNLILSWLTREWWHRRDMLTMM